MALISDLPNANPQKSDLMEIQNGQTSSNNSSVGQLMQLSASENLAPAYDANVGVYAVGDFVSYDGTLYQCNTAIATPEAFDATKWDAVKVTEITGEDIPVNTLTPDTSINSAINACFGRTGSDIPVSSSDTKTTIAEAIDSLVDFMTLKTANGTLNSTYTSSGSIDCRKKGGTLVIKLSGVLLKTLTSRTTIGSVPSGFVPPTQATGLIDASTILWGVNADGSVWIDSGASGKQVWGTLTNIVGG